MSSRKISIVAVAVCLCCAQLSGLEIDRSKLEPAGTIGSTGHGAVAIWQGSAVIGQGDRLVIRGLFDPLAESRVVALSGQVGDIKMWGDVAVVAAGNGLDLVDLTEPDPVPVRVDLGAIPSRISVNSNLAGVSSDFALHVVQLDTSSPAEVSRVAFGWSNTRSSVIPVAASGSWIYALEYDLYYAWGDLWTVDVSDPTSPQSSSRFWDDAYDDLIAVDQTLYGIGGRVQVIDVAVPEAPTVVLTLDESGQRGTIDGDRMILADPQQVTALDISDRRSPAVLSHLSSPYDPAGLALQGSSVVVAQGWAGSLLVDASNLTDLVALDRFEPEYGGSVMAGAAFSSGVVVAGGEFAAASPDGPLLAQKIAAYRTDDLELFGSVAGVSLINMKSDGDRVFALGRDVLVMLDFANPASPVELGRFALSPSVSRPRAFAVADDLVFLGLGAFFHLVDVSDPGNPTTLSRVEAPVYPDSLQVTSNGYLIVGGGGELHVFDIADPTTPSVVGHLAPETSPDLEPLSRVPFIDARDGEIGAILCEFQIDTPWDHTTPTCILLHASIDAGGNLTELGRAEFSSDSDFRPAVAMGDGYAVVTRPTREVGGASVLLYDLAQPGRLPLLTSAVHNDSPSAVALADDRAVVVDGNALCRVFDVTIFRQQRTIPELD